MKQKSDYERNRPPWLKVKTFNGPNYQELAELTKANGLHTVCEEASCPNIFECYENRTATFLILGDRCSRNCNFCNILTGPGLPIDVEEPTRVSSAVKTLGLDNVVITSVTRDDLHDGGAEIFANTVNLIKETSPECQIEVLVPDFLGSKKSLEIIYRSNPDIIAHNIETIERLYPEVRPMSLYKRSLKVISSVSKAGFTTKSGLMVGLGEDLAEIIDLMKDLRIAGTNILSIGQYLSPSAQHRHIEKYYTPYEFSDLEAVGYELGFENVFSGPLVRSSYRFL